MKSDKEKKESESKIQGDSYVWFHNTYPEYRGLLCYNLNNSKNKIEGARNKTMGLQKGRSDTVLYFKCKAHMIEFKTPTGSQSEDQIKWQKQIESQGFDYHIVKSKEEFISTINNIIKDDTPLP